jgi:hypothetical protein
MDATNDHLWGRCDCDCHRRVTFPLGHGATMSICVDDVSPETLAALMRVAACA